MIRIVSNVRLTISHMCVKCINRVLHFRTTQIIVVKKKAVQLGSSMLNITYRLIDKRSALDLGCKKLC